MNFLESGSLSFSEVLDGERDNIESECGLKETEREKKLCEIKIGINVLGKRICKAPAK